MPSHTIFPLASISHAPNLAPNPNRTTSSYPRSFTSLNALPQQLHSIAYIADARIQLIKINSVLQSAVLDVFPLRNLAVGGYETVAEAQGDDGLVGVKVLSTQDYNVSQAFRCAMFALDIVGRVDAVSKGCHYASSEGDKSRIFNPTHLPIKLNVRSTLSETLSIVGTIKSLKQSLASGHLDIMCTSRGTSSV